MQSKTKVLRRALALLFASTLVAAACGSDADTGTDTDTDASTATTEADTDSTEAAGSDTTEAAGDDAAASGDVLIGLITKTESNPFFVKMREGAEAKADELGVEFQAFAGESDGDNDAQVKAIEDLIAAGAKGILITPSDSAAIVPTVQKARDAGILVIALDTPLDPIDSADATFATDNFAAGELIGQWAAANVDPESAKIAMLDLAENQPTVDVLRDQGFLQGFGIDLGDDTKWGDEDDPRIVGHEVTSGSEEGGRAAMEKLLAIDPDINLVYTINEPAAAGAKLALDAAGSTDVTIVSVDGGCPGVEDVEAGVIGATSMQFPLLMASMGVEAVVEFAESGAKPENSAGLDFFNTGVQLITDSPVDGIESEDTAWGLENCWG
jgi:fructose transport system substrate-binding protein